MVFTYYFKSVAVEMTNYLYSWQAPIVGALTTLGLLKVCTVRSRPAVNGSKNLAAGRTEVGQKGQNNDATHLVQT